MSPREHYRQAVHYTPFHARTSAANVLNLWHRWRDHTVADAYLDTIKEITARKNKSRDLLPSARSLG